MLFNLLLPAITAVAPLQGVSEPPRVDLWLNDRGVYEQGDRMRIFFRTDMDSYVTVVRITTEGHVRILFPEGPLENNYVAGGADYEVVQYGQSDYRVHDVPGDGYVFAVTSTVPFNYSSFANGAVWDYHLLAFEGEDDRDPYDTFAHFMDDVLVPDTRETFSYEAVAYSVDARGSRYYANAYRYYSRPYYQGCNVYRAFWGLRPYYVYDYDCARVGVTIILGSGGHYYHNHYYHYGYGYDYDTFYYGYGSVYRYRYVSGGYRHNHGARRVTNRVLAGYRGTDRHSVPNRGGITGRRSGGRAPLGNAAAPRRTTNTSGSPVRRSPGARRVIPPRSQSRTPANATPRRRTTGTGGINRPAPNRADEEAPNRRRSNAEDRARRRGMTPITRPPNSSAGNANPPTRSSTGNLSRRRGSSSSSAGSARPTPRTRQPTAQPRRQATPSRPRQSAPAPRRQATPRQRPGGGSVSRPSSPRRSPSVRRSPSRSTGSSRPRGGSARPAPPRSGGGSRSPARSGGGSRRRPGN